MTDGQQSSRRHAPRRLLLLTGLGIGAGLGIAFIIDSPAQAGDHTPTPGAVTTRTVHNATELPADVRDQLTAAAPPQQRARHTDTPRPIRDLTTETLHVTERAIRDTGAAVKHTTDRADDATQPLPVARRAVNEVTDVTTRVADAVTTTTARLPEQIDLPDIAPAAGDSDTPADAPHTPAVQYPPAPLPHQDTARPAAGERRPHTHAALRESVTAPQREPAGHRHLDGDGDHADHPGMSNNRSIECTATAAWLGPSRWQQAITEYVAQHAGRTEHPAPPSG